MWQKWVNWGGFTSRPSKLLNEGRDMIRTTGANPLFFLFLDFLNNRVFDALGNCGNDFLGLRFRFVAAG